MMRRVHHLQRPSLLLLAPVAAKEMRHAELPSGVRLAELWEVPDWGLRAAGRPCFVVERLLLFYFWTRRT